MSKLAQDGDVNKEDGELIFNPYNERNIEITEDEVCDILKKYGVPDKVHNMNLYKRAFVHKSYCKRPKLENEENGIIIADQPVTFLDEVSKRKIFYLLESLSKLGSTIIITSSKELHIKSSHKILELN